MYLQDLLLFKATYEKLIQHGNSLSGAILSALLIHIYQMSILVDPLTSLCDIHCRLFAIHGLG